MSNTKQQQHKIQLGFRVDDLSKWFVYFWEVFRRLHLGYSTVGKDIFMHLSYSLQYNVIN